ncbi:MAG: tetratricopeptide repeat protein [Desulfobacterales bacterium]|nr:tetratricopeptide repeat protein [Desulfobacterales bacterium]
MTKPALQKIYVILGKRDKSQLEGLCRTLSGHFSYVNMTSNLYLVAESLPDGMPQVERIQKDVGKFLEGNLFARLYVHFVHRVPHMTMNEIDFYYQYYYKNWKRTTRAFDQEGYMHQEVPRLMLLPVIVPDAHAEPDSIKGLLDALKGSFLPPSLYLDTATFFLAQDERLLSSTEKIYYGTGNSREMTDIVCNLNHQDILDDSSSRLESENPLMTDPCPAALILSAQDGAVYPCMDAFCKKNSLADIHGKLSADTIMDRYSEHGKSKRGCLACRERVAASFADLPVPEETRHEIGALLYHLGTLHQEAEEHAQAISNYKKSLELSPVEEAGPVYFRLGLGYTKAGRYDEAIEAFKMAEPAYHGQYYFHFYTGLCCFEKGDYRVALERFSKAVDLEPQLEDLVAILIYMGTCHNSLCEYEEALVPLERAKKAAGHSKEISSALGFAYFKLKDYDRAIENLGRAVEIDPYSAIDYASLGSNYRERGDVNTAIAMYEKALALDPSITSARENLEKLKGKP